MVVLLFELYDACYRLFNYYGFFSSLLLPFVRINGFLLVVAAFIFNMNGKARPAIACAASALGIKLVLQLLGSRSNILSVLINILAVLPEVALLVFVIKPKGNVRPWLFIAWGAVFLPVILDNAFFLLRWSSREYIVLSFVRYFALQWISYVPLGFVYFFGFMDKRNAVCPQTAAKRTTATPYLDEYKRNRLHGGK